MAVKLDFLKDIHYIHQDIFSHCITPYIFLFYGNKLTRVKETICLGFIMNLIKSLWA